MICRFFNPFHMDPALSDLCYFNPSFAHRVSKGAIEADACVYGGSSAGVVSAVKLAALGWSVVLLEPGPQLGGMTASGLGYTDIGNKAAIGGMARDFYRKIGREYGVPEAWTFEPHVARAVFEAWVRDAGVLFHKRQYLASVQMRGGSIESLRTLSGMSVRARVFIDASYEGDLMASAGVRHTVGREDNACYSERINGAQVGPTHQFDFPVDPYVVEGDPASGLAFGVEEGEPVIGAGDERIQAYCFRMCLTDDPENRLPFQRPASFDPRKYVLLGRYLAAGWRDVFTKFDRLRTGSKTDTNNHGAVSTDHVGQSHRWPKADYAERERIFQEHISYQQGLHWYMANAPEVPRDIREAYSRWGLCRDEFVETGGWPHQLYVREARRMVSSYVMTEHECRATRRVPDPVGLAAYTMDSHNCRRFVRNGRVLNEGDVQEHGFPPYGISLDSIRPAAGDCSNILVPVCLSASHIAYGSIRMEPVFMVLGESAAVVAHLALAGKVPVHEVPYANARPLLEAAGQILEWDSAKASGKGALHADEAVRG